VALGEFDEDRLPPHERTELVPRLLALHVTLPLLTAESIVVGICSGYVVGVYLLGIDSTITIPDAFGQLHTLCDGKPFLG
jgi:hypothetical protein